MEEINTRLDHLVLQELIAHFQAHPQIQNIDVMNASGFCRNCLAKWRHRAAKREGIPNFTYEDSLQYVYGMPLSEYKSKYQTKATESQLHEFNSNTKHHANHDGFDASPVVSFQSSACCDEIPLGDSTCPLPGSTLPAIVYTPHPISVAILVTSDRASTGIYADLSGPIIKRNLDLAGHTVQHLQVLPDEEESIVDFLTMWSSKVDCILTCGGTGLSKRDVTPQATLRVVNRLLPGVTEFLRRESSRQEPLAWLSRAESGSVDGKCVIVNLPGHPNAAEMCTRLLLPLLPRIVTVSKQ